MSQLAQWALWHVAALDIILGVFPFAAFLLMTIYGLRPAAPRELRIFAAVGLGMTVWFLVVVSAFALTPTVTRILERNLFHVMPLFFIALVAWIARGAPRPWWAVAPAALFAATLTLALADQQLPQQQRSSTARPGLLPLWRWRDGYFSAGVDRRRRRRRGDRRRTSLFVCLPRRWVATVTLVLLAC